MSILTPQVREIQSRGMYKKVIRSPGGDDGGRLLSLAIVKLYVQVLAFEGHPSIAALEAFHWLAHRPASLDLVLINSNQRPAGAEDCGPSPFPKVRIQNGVMLGVGIENRYLSLPI
jgi:hypothetical protein